MNKNYSGLTSVGSEVISPSSPSQRNLLFSAGKRPKLIVKSYKITNDTSIPDISNNVNNKSNKSNKSNIIEEKNLSTVKIVESKKESSLNLSNIKYKDGYILKDAVNGNPGYGLWSIKTPVEDNKKKEEIKKEEKINLTMNNNIPNKKIFNDNDLNYKYTKFFDEDKKENKKNKKIIEKLSNKLNDLEKKYMKALSNFQEKKSLCENTIKMRKEYEQMFNNNLKEIELIKEKTKEMNKENKIVSEALTHSKNEIERLLNVIKEDDENMIKLNSEFDIRLKKEEEEKKRLKEIVKEKEEQITILQEQTKNITTNTFFEEDLFQGNVSKKDYEIKKLKDIILNLHIKISGLKKEINNNNEQKEKLEQILRYKNMKEEFHTLNISSLFNVIEEKERNDQRNNNILKKQNEIIKNLNESLKAQYNIITSKKLQKSLSQGILINK